MWQPGKNHHVHLMRDESRTVLVLGAGASTYLGFPLGPQLCFKIIENTSDPGRKPFNELLAMGFSQQKIQSFHERLDKSYTRSIDEFLSDRPEHIDIGRAAIAQVLIRYENGKVLRTRHNNWYGLLRNRIKEDITRNRFSPVIVTFNYDLSLDKFLFDFLTNTFERYDKINTLEGSVRLLHVHGRLGYLDYEVKHTSRRPYGRHVSPHEILAASQGIRVPGQLENDYGRDMEVAQEAIKQAECVIFLGFGYDSTNLFRLRIDAWESGKYFGTAYGLGKARIQELLTLSEKRLILGDPDLGICDYLKSADCWNDD